MVKETNCLEETIEFGKELGKNANRGDVFCLTGDLGTGKTMMSKGIAMGLGLDEDEITSPTFTIVNTYEQLEKPLYHFDVYRINDIEEMNDIGYEEMFYGEGVCIVEWADMIEELIPDNATWIKIEKDLSKGLDYRKITIEK